MAFQILDHTCQLQWLSSNLYLTSWLQSIPVSILSYIIFLVNHFEKSWRKWLKNQRNNSKNGVQHLPKRLVSIKTIFSLFVIKILKMHNCENCSNQNFYWSCKSLKVAWEWTKFPLNRSQRLAIVLSFYPTKSNSKSILILT